MVRYPNGSEVPLEPRGNLKELGYRCVGPAVRMTRREDPLHWLEMHSSCNCRLMPESESIKRDINVWKLEQRILEEKQAAYDLQMKLRMEALSLETAARGNKAGGKQKRVGGGARPSTAPAARA